jgi:hypothetical protein
MQIFQPIFMLFIELNVLIRCFLLDLNLLSTHIGALHYDPVLIPGQNGFVSSLRASRFLELGVELIEGEMDAGLVGIKWEFNGEVDFLSLLAVLRGNVGIADLHRAILLSVIIE